MIVRTSQDELQQYLLDQANLRGACEKVFFPENTNEVAEVILKANDLKMPLSICGNHTSLTGASLPSSGWVLATEKLDGIIEVNPEGGYIITQPGVTLFDLQKELKNHNLFFPPDPTEDSCFIGGMIGTNASGARSFKYGATRDSILEIEVVLPTGDIITISRSENIEGNTFRLRVTDRWITFNIPEEYVVPDVKNAAGYFLKPGMSLIDIFIGAEGTLGVITKAKLLVRQIPANNISLVVFFDDLGRGFKFLNAIRDLSEQNKILKNLNIQARAIEFFDQESLEMLRPKYSSIPVNASAAFWVEQDCMNEEEHSRLLDEWSRFLEECQINLDDVWFSADESDRSKIIGMRHNLPLLVNDIVKHRGVRKIGTDMAVPDHLFEDFYYSSITSVKKGGFDYVAFGHFGDSHLHLNILSRNMEELELGKELCDYLCEDAILKGGTFSAEHGVGKLKRSYLNKMMGENNMVFMRRVKQLFDPNNILGIGNLFDTK